MLIDAGMTHTTLAHHCKNCSEMFTPFCHNVHSFGQKSKHCGKKGVNVSLQFLQCAVRNTSRIDSRSFSSDIVNENFSRTVVNRLSYLMARVYYQKRCHKIVTSKVSMVTKQKLTSIPDPL